MQELYEPILEKMDKTDYNTPESRSNRKKIVPIQISAGDL